ncbi:Uncharacterised protein [Streptococcus pneumoniae]|nr:Uncharacterised protein [Streptococcus pneumoniae]
MRGGHRGAVVGGVAGRRRGGGAVVHGRDDVRARGGHVHGGAVVGERGAGALRGGGGHHDGVPAVGRAHVGGGLVLVARRHDDGHAAGDGRVDRVLVGGAAHAGATEGHVDDVRRVRVGRHARHGAAGGPHDRVGDVGQRTAALAEHADGLDLRVRGHTDDALGVGHGRDGARHVGAVPRGVRGAGGAALAGGVPVALVTRIGVAATAVARRRAVGDEVVAGHDVAVEIRVGGDAGVDDGHGRTGARRAIPRPGDPHAVAAGEAPLLRVEGVHGAQAGGGEERVRLHGLDRPGGLQVGHELRGLGLIQLAVRRDHAGAERGLTQLLHGDSGLLRGLAPGVRAALRVGIGGGLLVGDDEGVVAVGVRVLGLRRRQG